MDRPTKKIKQSLKIINPKYFWQKKNGEKAIKKGDRNREQM